jgi:hypothetical protein
MSKIFEKLILKRNFEIQKENNCNLPEKNSTFLSRK